MRTDLNKQKVVVTYMRKDICEHRATLVKPIIMIIRLGTFNEREHLPENLCRLDGAHFNLMKNMPPRKSMQIGHCTFKFNERIRLPKNSFKIILTGLYEQLELED